MRPTINADNPEVRYALAIDRFSRLKSDSYEAIRDRYDAVRSAIETANESMRLQRQFLLAELAVDAVENIGIRASDMYDAYQQYKGKLLEMLGTE